MCQKTWSLSEESRCGGEPDIAACDSCKGVFPVPVCYGMVTGGYQDQYRFCPHCGVEFTGESRSQAADDYHYRQYENGMVR